MKWLIRIILKNNYSGIYSESQLLRAVHPCGNPIFNMHSSLYYCAQTIRNLVQAGFKSESYVTSAGTFHFSRYKESLARFAKPTCGIFIKCMQSERPKSVAELLDVLSSKNQETTLFAEIKYDGERMQIHIERNNSHMEPSIQIFSKSGRNSTYDRIFTHPIIKKALDWSDSRPFGIYQPDGNYSHPFLHVDNAIFEAELAVYNEELKSIEIFGGISDFTTRKKTAGRKTDHRHLIIVFFDVLYFNDVSLLREPFFARRKLLETLIRKEPTFV
jgi:DNA ligase-4